MGRKPNALILEFFERGAKLEDASNRYQHTCRKCGEKFPKGRIDSLTNHLVKKCPMISLRDRQKALLQLNDLPDQIADSARIQNPSQNADAQMSGHPVELPIVNRNWTALQTLAEVSRLTDINEKQNDRVQHNSSAGARSRTSEPPRSGFELQEQYTLDNPPTSYEQRGNREKKASNPKTTPRRDSEATLPPANFRRMSHSRSRSPTLEEAATSIAAAARAVGAAFIPNMVEQHNLDPQLLAEDNINVPMDNAPDMSESTAIAQLTQANATMPNQFYSPTPGEQQPWQISQPMMESHGSNMFPEQDHIPQELQNALQHGGMMRTDGVPQLSMNQFNQGMTTEFSAEWGNGQKTNRPKVRGRFTPNRRDEVQKVRKKGACIRCRMLKKPCSEGDPCDTCKNVESARLWKQPCLRTRLADELNMYSAALYGVLSHNEINAAKHRVKFVSSPNQIDISHYPETTVYATFKALEGLEAPAEGNIDPTLGLNFHGAPTLRILDNENDDLPMKLEAYMKRISPVFFEKEPSRFMNVTLKTASELSVQKDDQLLKKALEFWSIVHILVDTELRWTITQRGNVDDEAGQGQVIELRQDEKDNAFSVMCTQLNAAAEKKAAAICKTVFGDLERRLLHKTANNSFELFLVALILLNCVEKSTWLFKMWEHSNFPSRWPLDKTPNWFASRGDKVIDLLQMLLRIRNIPPKTYTTEGGTLASDGSGTKMYTKEEDGVVATDGSQDARQFFENIQLSYDDVLNKQNHHVFVPSDSRCYELRFCSRLLLPTN